MKRCEMIRYAAVLVGVLGGAKSRAVLASQELDLAHELADAFQSLHLAYQTARSHYNRRIAAEKELDVFRVKEEINKAVDDVDAYLRSQQRLASAESDYFNSIVEYTKAITNIDPQQRKVAMQLGDIPQGIYFVILENQTERLVSKLIRGNL